MIFRKKKIKGIGAAQGSSLTPALIVPKKGLSQGFFTQKNKNKKQSIDGVARFP